MRIGLISQWYDPEGSSAATPGVIARAMSARGHDVHVTTGFPNYPSGRVFSGYRVRAYQRESLRGVTVHRSPLFVSHDSSAARRALNYLTFAAGATAVAATRMPVPDAVLVHGTPATAAIPALALKALRHTPFVYHVQDLWPHTVLHSDFLSRQPSGLERALHVMCDTIYRAASSVAVTSPSMAELIASRGVPEDKIVFVPNWADEAAFRPSPKDPALAARWGITRRFTLMYAGVFGPYQSLDVMLGAALLLRDRAEIGFALVGGGVAEPGLREFVRTHRLDNVTFVPPQAFDTMADVLALGDAQLISLRHLPLFEATLPSKLQATLAAGRPIVGAVGGDAAKVIRASGAGVVVTQGSARALADAVCDLSTGPERRLHEMSVRSRCYYQENYSEDVAVSGMLSLLEAASRSRTPTRSRSLV